MNKTILILTAALLGMVHATRAATVVAADLDYGISATQSNNFNFDFSGEPVWTAGSQRSENELENNKRTGRVFVDFQLDQGIINTAQGNSTVLFTFAVDSIGLGDSVPYTDGLDLRYLGVNASDRSASTLWNTIPVGGGDQADILATTATTPGTFTVELTNPQVIIDIRNATAGQYIAFGMSNSVGYVPAYTVGNTLEETYGFQMNTSASSYLLTVAVPEPASLALLAIGAAMIARLRKRG